MNKSIAPDQLGGMPTSVRPTATPFNVSMTVDFSTDPILRAQMVNYANGILREGFGWTPRSRSIVGPSFWTKAVLQKALRDAPWIKKKKTANAQIEFRLNRAEPGAIVNLPAAAE